jgi:hypothetical protein
MIKCTRNIILDFNFKISGTFNNGSSTLWSVVEDYKIINYEPGNAKDRYEGANFGKGTLYYRNGQKLIGNFEIGQINGSAKLFSANGDILKSGTFIGTNDGLYFVKEEVTILSGKISEWNFTAEGKLYFASNKIFIGNFNLIWPRLELLGEGQLIDDNGEKIEEGVSSLKRFTDDDDGVKDQYGIYFGKEAIGTVSGKIYLTNGKTYQGEFEIQKFEIHLYYFNPTEGTLFSYDGTIIQEGKWENGKFLG